MATTRAERRKDQAEALSEGLDFRDVVLGERKVRVTLPKVWWLERNEEFLKVWDRGDHRNRIAD